jgi:hypothetical protein
MYSTILRTVIHLIMGWIIRGMVVLCIWHTHLSHQMKRGFECGVTQLLSHSSMDNLSSVIRSVGYGLLAAGR